MGSSAKNRARPLTQEALMAAGRGRTRHRPWPRPGHRQLPATDSKVHSSALWWGPRECQSQWPQGAGRAGLVSDREWGAEGWAALRCPLKHSLEATAGAR